MPNLVGDSNDRNVAALRVYNMGIGGPGALIYGYSPQGNFVFQVFNNGDVWSAVGYNTAGRINAAGSIFSGGDVYARGVRLTSDKNAKENFYNVNPLEILDKLVSMPIQSWNFKEEASSERHIGPTAQDFQAAFGLNGDDNTHISSIDLQGVALAAIQGLNEKNEKLKAENAQLQAALANLEARLSVLEANR
jgi:hypothetical protein